MEYACTVCGAISNRVRCPSHRPAQHPSALARTSTRAWRRLRLTVLERDRWTCQRCGKPATEVDHVLPVAKGGRDEAWNLIATCLPCNRRKGKR